ncbi:hypothetical protein DERP_010842 [Dermatophagoides pteronyssinus]|uniref:Uncharacterized protein n=1 Tax=Dermatophagoides pteronyssinus TaxID=6956 RepID=A0ABQ8JUH8_DERPT|nr:hypothetical protein DERP_010842 [Dermatophagoides pteronyssinus]
MSQKYRLLTIDITYLFHLDDFINLISIPLIFMIQYFFRIFYLKFNQRLFNIIWKIFHNHQCNDYFLYPTFHYSQSSYNCCSFIYKNSYRFLYAFQPIIIVLNIMIIILHFIYLKILFIGNNNDDQPIFWENLQIFIIQLVIAELNCLFTLFIWFCMAHILILATVVLFIFASVIFIKLDQCNQLIKSIMYRMIMILKNSNNSNNKLQQQQLFINYRLDRFMFEHTDTLTLVEKTDQQYSNLLTIFLLSTTPLNIILMGSFIIQLQQQQQQKTLLEQLLSLSMTFQQWIGVFGAHLLFACFSTKIHKCSKSLLSLATNHYYSTTTTTDIQQNHHQHQFCWPIRRQLRLANYIEKFHTKNHYGLTYSKITLISFKSFAKFLFIYVKCFCFAYKLLKKSNKI